ncbi:family 43 glycosylhydrolase [Streptomyces sp. NPDC005373]|uniref:glycoside hydrolase family 43 protein n=1 Tax=Streptomyces sp. NPDC005373 TaxID=3156879 RepID=UPI0033BC1477
MSELPNPLIPGFNPDPSCVRVDGTYYLVASSFEYLPALPVYRSTDFVTWEHIGNVATRPEQTGIARSVDAAGVWAPTIRHHDGLFYVIVSIVDSPRGCVVFTAEDPAGPWDDGTTLEGIAGIDPDLAWDENGAAYVTYSALELDGAQPVGFHGIRQARVDLAAGKTLEAPRSLWSGVGMVAPEAPHLFRRDGHWYLLIAEGGTDHGHAVSIARGPSIEGPFEPAPHNPVLRGTGFDHGVERVGHADLVEGPDGTDLLVLLGTRYAGAASPLGRETYVTEVEWADGWPQPAPVRANPRPEPVDEHFDFTAGARLTDPGWLAVGRPPADLVTTGGAGSRLTLIASHADGGLDTFRPTFVGRRQRHLHCTFEARVEAGSGRGGIGLRFAQDFTLALTAQRTASGDGTRITARADIPSFSRSWSVELADEQVLLRLRTEPPAPGRAAWLPNGDRILLSAVDGTGTEHEVAELDGRYWSVENAPTFTGRVVGVFAEQGTVHITEFRYRGEGRS